MPTEILACPHCERLFRTTPEILGKKIRCRGCRESFFVPKDTGSVPLRHAVVDEGFPVAITCVLNGREARRCPNCSRLFTMKPALIGKVIRCRGCRKSFCIEDMRSSPAEPKPVGHEHAGPVKGPMLQNQPSPRAYSDSTRGAPQAQPRPVSFRPPPQPTVFDDIGDVLEDIMPGEQVASVVRPQNPGPSAQAADSPVATFINIVLGGFCALPITQMILWWVFGKDPLKLAPMAPEILRWLVPSDLLK